MLTTLLILLLVLLGAVLAAAALARWCPESLTRWTLVLGRRALGLKRRVALVSGWRIVYLEGGRGAPLILLHGLGADKDNFLLVARALARHYRVILPDLPGFGESDRPVGAGYRLSDQIARLHAFCGQLGLQRFHLGGNSMGGLLAGAYAAAHPQQVESLWLLAPAGVKAARASELMSAIASGRPIPILARSVEEVNALMHFVMHRPPPMPRYMLSALAAQQARAYEHNQRIIAQLIQGPWLDELLDANAPPSLIVWGERDRALDVSGAQVLGRLIPHSQVIIMPDVGHVPMIEAPRTVVNDYLKFRAGLLAGAECSPCAA